MSRSKRVLCITVAVIGSFLCMQTPAFAADVLSVSIASQAAQATDGGGGGGDGCAAAYVLGEDDPGLASLRQLRDEVLAKTAAGEGLIEAYYGLDSKVLSILEENPALKPLAEKIIKALIPAVNLLTP